MRQGFLRSMAGSLRETVSGVSRFQKSERLSVGYETLVHLNLSLIRKAEPIRHTTFVGEFQFIRSRVLL